MLSSVLDIILTAVTTSVAAVAALRVLRAFKPLRLLTRSAGMRLVFKSVTMSLMSMANVSVVCVLFFLIFAILGVQLFAGRFYRCSLKWREHLLYSTCIFLTCKPRCSDWKVPCLVCCLIPV